MKKRIDYCINICPVIGHPVCFKVTKKEFERFINDYQIKNTERVLNWSSMEEYRYKYEKNDIKIIAVKTIY